MSFEKDVLSIKGEKKKPYGDDVSRVTTGRSYSKIDKEYKFPNDVDKEKISAEFKDGVLIITVPKNLDSQAVNIDIK